MNNHGLTTVRSIPSTAGAQDKVREVNTAPKPEKPVYYDQPETVDWTAHFEGLGREC